MKIQYGYKMIRNMEERDTLEMVEFDIKDLPGNIVKIIKTHKAFSKSGIFGEKGLGEPQEYEKLIIADDKGTKVFEYYNKGIYYMKMGSEADRPIFQVFAYLMMKKFNKMRGKGE